MSRTPTWQTATMTGDPRQQGTVMVLVMTILIALLAGGAVALYIQVTDTKSTGMVKSSRSALFCAEAGLAFATETILDNYSTWNDVFDGAPLPSWYDNPGTTVVGIEGDIDDPTDGAPDFAVTIDDNPDEFPTPNPLADNDLRIFVRSTCTKYRDTPVTVVQMVEVRPARQQYEQEGHGQDKVGFLGSQ